MTFCVDTSALLDAWVRWYPPDLFPSLWERLHSLAANGHLISTEEVLHELERRDDDLHKWCKQRSDIFLPHEQDIQYGVSEILAEFPRLVDNRTGKSFADPFVISVARHFNATLVTGEKPTGKQHRPKIPDVCDRFGIRWISLVEMVRELGWTF